MKQLTNGCHCKMIKIRTIIKRIIFWKQYRCYSKFGHFGDFSYIKNPLRIHGFENIKIGHNVHIKERCWLAAEPLTGCDKVQLLIDDGAVIGDYNHIIATSSVIIEKKVLTANHVYISDNIHGYQDVKTPIVEQPIQQLSDVVIGEGSWIGENVCVIGASIGRHCVIGANAVVTKDIPDYCVAVGAPAHIIKRYDEVNHIWRKIIKTDVFNEEKECFQ